MILSVYLHSALLILRTSRLDQVAEGIQHGREAAVEEQEQLVLGLVHQLPLLDLLLVLQLMTTDLLATGEKCLVTRRWWLVTFTDTFP